MKDVNTLTNVFRGYFFDDTGAPIVRGNLSDNDVLTLRNVGWVFVEDNGTTVDVTYLQPVYSYVAPSSPTTGQYWFDITNQVWKRYSGVEFEVINRILIGIVVMDDSACIAARSSDFTNAFNGFNNVKLDIESSEILRSRDFSSRVSVYGVEVIQDLNKLEWNITTDLETGLVETVDIDYYVYISTQGQTVLSNEKPYERPDLKGFYHPYHTWRCLGIVYNNGSSDLELSTWKRFFTAYSVADVEVAELSGVSGYGSTNTVIPYATTVDVNTIRYLGTLENNSTDGISFTAKVKCRIRAFYTMAITSGGYIGFSKNSTELTTNIVSINPADIIDFGYSQSGNYPTYPQAPIDIEINDVIRPHASGAGIGSTTQKRFFITVERIR